MRRGICYSENSFDIKNVSLLAVLPILREIEKTKSSHHHKKIAFKSDEDVVIV